MPSEGSLKFTYELHESVDGVICFYCGDKADTNDHCPPLCQAKIYPSAPRILVKACVVCNSTLSYLALPTLTMRLEFLLKRYKKKYKRILNLPKWDEEELSELSGNLKVYVQKESIKKDFHVKRMNHIQKVLDELLEKNSIS